MKRSLTGIILLLGLSAWHPAAKAQVNKGSLVISGKVTSFEESLPLEGVSVVVKGSANTTGTQADGTFTLLVAPVDTILVVSLAGYETQEVKTSGKNKQYDIVLKRSDKSITCLSVQQPGAALEIPGGCLSYRLRRLLPG